MNKKLPKTRVYKLKRDSAPYSFLLQNRHKKSSPLLFNDPEKGPRELRYATNQPTPFVDEQKGTFTLGNVEFKEGMLVVREHEKNLQSFIDVHPKKDILFVEVDGEKDAEADIDKLDLEDKARDIAKNLSPEEYEKIFRVAFGRDPERYTMAEIKRDIRVYAKNNPSNFLSLVSSPEVTDNNELQSLFDEAVLTLRNKKTEIFYNLEGNKSRMCVVPHGSNYIDTLKERFTKGEGPAEYKMLINVLRSKTE